MEIGKKAEELFHAAADLPEDERAALLDRECRGDPKLRREVESLLAFDRSPVVPIAGALQEAAKSVLQSGGRAGRRAGPYRITHEIGAGGMGAVYAAVRDDDQYQKRVAIKLVKSTLAPAAILERFRQERQILAGLDHPYIARLLDGGTTEDGAPFLVMEYIEGIPIDTYCEQRNLPIEQRCMLFCKACEAVSYAHRNLVIHRDLKPGHILIDRDGVPKLLDFGIAKLVTPDSVAGPDNTGTVLWALTPDYASPEQIRGEPVATGTDIYSLGAVLYRLLTGVRPHGLQSYTPSEIERVVCQTEPLRPSLAASSPSVRKRLAGDLDNIVLAAMRKEPQRRYASVHEFCEDIRRHFAGLPISAREATFAYRAGKFLKRRRAWVAAGLLTAAGLAGGTGVAIWQAREADQARQAAERERARAQQARNQAELERSRAVSAMGVAETNAREAEEHREVAERRLAELIELANRSVFDIQGAIERLPGATEARRRIAATTLEFVDRMYSEAGDDPRILRVLASAYWRVGDVQGQPLHPNLGDTAGALASYRKSEKILVRLAAKEPGDVPLQQERSDIYYRIGAILESGGKVEEALGAYGQALALSEGLVSRNTGNNRALMQVGVLSETLARIFVNRNPGKARAYSGKAVAAFETLVARAPAHGYYLQGLSNAYSIAGLILSNYGTIEESVAQFRKTAEMRERLVRLDPHDASYQRNLMIAYSHIGDKLGNPMLDNLSDSAGALEYFDKARGIAESLAAADAADRTAQADLGTILMRSGAVLANSGRGTEALPVLRKAAGIMESLGAADPNSLRYKDNLAIIHEYIGLSLGQTGDPAGALENYRRSLEIARAQTARSASAAPRAQVLASLRRISETLGSTGDRDGALSAVREAIAAAENYASTGPLRVSMQRHVADSQSWTGAIYEILAGLKNAPVEQRREDWRHAREAYAESLAAWQRLAQTQQLAIAQARISAFTAKLAYCDSQLGR